MLTRPETNHIFKFYVMMNSNLFSFYLMRHLVLTLVLWAFAVSASAQNASPQLPTTQEAPAPEVNTSGDVPPPPLPEGGGIFSGKDPAINIGRSLNSNSSSSSSGATADLLKNLADQAVEVGSDIGVEAEVQLKNVADQTDKLIENVNNKAGTNIPTLPSFDSAKDSDLVLPKLPSQIEAERLESERKRREMELLNRKPEDVNIVRDLTPEQREAELDSLLKEAFEEVDEKSKKDSDKTKNPEANAVQMPSGKIRFKEIKNPDEVEKVVAEETKKKSKAVSKKKAKASSPKKTRSTRKSGGINYTPEASQSVNDKKRKELKAARKNKNYKTQILPKSIYKKQYSKRNMHLPKAIYAQDIDMHLFAAAARGDKKDLRALMDAGRSPNVITKNGDTPLMAAISADQTSIVQMLILRGANVSTSNSKGNTPLHMAAHSGNDAVVDMLLAAKAPLNKVNRYGDTPLMAAAAGRSVGVIDKLVNAGAEVNARNRRGLTALHIAAYNGKRPVVEELLGSRANIEIRDNSKMAAYDLALAGGHPALAEILRPKKVVRRSPPVVKQPVVNAPRQAVSAPRAVIKQNPISPLSGAASNNNAPKLVAKGVESPQSQAQKYYRYKNNMNRVDRFRMSPELILQLAKEATDGAPIRPLSQSLVAKDVVVPTTHSVNVVRKKVKKPHHRPASQAYSPKANMEAIKAERELKKVQEQRWQQRLDAWMSADLRFNSLSDQEKRFYNEERHQLTKKFPKYFSMANPADRAEFDKYMRRWYNLGKVSKRTILPAKGSVNVAAKEADIFQPKSASLLPPPIRVNKSVPRKLAKPIFVQKQELDNLVDKWLRVDSHYNRFSQSEKIEANKLRHVLLQKMNPSNPNAEYAAATRLMPRQRFNQLMLTMRKWDDFEAGNSTVKPEPKKKAKQVFVPRPVPKPYFPVKVKVPEVVIKNNDIKAAPVTVQVKPVINDSKVEVKNQLKEPDPNVVKQIESELRAIEIPAEPVHVKKNGGSKPAEDILKVPEAPLEKKENRLPEIPTIQDGDEVIQIPSIEDFNNEEPIIISPIQGNSGGVDEEIFIPKIPQLPDEAQNIPVLKEDPTLPVILGGEDGVGIAKPLELPVVPALPKTSETEVIVIEQPVAPQVKQPVGNNNVAPPPIPLPPLPR